MRYFIFLFSAILLFSCNKGTLNPTNLKRVVIFQVDYLTYAFQGGKEFAYFQDDTSTINLPIDSFYLPPSGTDGRLSITYTGDTIFDGFVSQNLVGEVEFPQNIDNQIHYFRNKEPLNLPDLSKFQIAFYDLVSEPIPYDSIWKSVSRLTKLQDYQFKNPIAKIGLFLYRPAQDPLFQNNWKWFVILKN